MMQGMGLATIDNTGDDDDINITRSGNIDVVEFEAELEL